MKEKLRDKPWFHYAVALCIAVTLYVILTHLKTVFDAVGTFIGYFGALLLGGVLAYLLNPLARFYQRTIFRKGKKEKLRWVLSVLLTVLTLLLVLGILLGMLIPQLIDSGSLLLDNLPGYLRKLQDMTEKLGIAETLNLEQLIKPSGDMVATVVGFLRDNAGNILDAGSSAGRVLVKWLIALIVSVYLLLAKDAVKAGFGRLFRALLPAKRYEKFSSFVVRCDGILVRYLVFSLLDALIVGAANAVFMLCLGMPYIGLVSMVVALTNLIPTFGPIIGCVIGGFILLLVNPWFALEFVAFTLFVQFLDGYVIKPKLFGNSLGVSGLLILLAVIVCGNMFGIVGMLLAIPLAAILDILYKEEFLPALERRRKKKDSTTMSNM